MGLLAAMSSSDRDPKSADRQDWHSLPQIFFCRSKAQPNPIYSYFRERTSAGFNTWACLILYHNM